MLTEDCHCHDTSSRVAVHDRPRLHFVLYDTLESTLCTWLECAWIRFHDYVQDTHWKNNIVLDAHLPSPNATSAATVGMTTWWSGFWKTKPVGWSVTIVPLVRFTKPPSTLRSVDCRCQDRRCMKAPFIMFSASSKGSQSSHVMQTIPIPHCVDSHTSGWQDEPLNIKELESACRNVSHVVLHTRVNMASQGLSYLYIQQENNNVTIISKERCGGTHIRKREGCIRSMHSGNATYNK